MKKLITLLLFNSVLMLYAQDIDIKGKITTVTGEPLPGVDIIVKNTTNGTTSDFEGEFTITASATGTLIFSYLGFSSTEVEINNQTFLSVQLLESAAQLEELIIVGTRGQARSKLKTAAPVDVIKLSEEAINLPQLDVAQVLASTAPSFQAIASQGGDLSSSVTPPTLRGLGPNQLLVLVNGKRRHSGAQLIASPTGGSDSNSVDLSFIPLDGVDRVEVLRDGASAQYGSDAIAGVINFITKKATNKFTANYSVGIYTNNNPDISDSNISESDQALLDEGDPDGVTHQIGLNYGTSLENGGYFNITGTYRQNESAIRPNISGATAYGESYLNNQRTDEQGNLIITNPELLAAQAAGNTALAAELQTDAGLLAARGLTQRDISTFAGLPTGVLGTIAYDIELPLSETSDFYSFGDVGFKTGDIFGCFYRRSAQTDRFNFDLYPNGFRPQMVNTQTNIGFTGGIKGKLGDWDFDLSNTVGTNTQRISQFNTLNASLQSESPTELDLGRHSFTQNTANFDITKFFPDVLKGLNIAAGAEARIENYVIEAGQDESFEAGDAGLVVASEDNQELVGPNGLPLEDLNGTPIIDENGNAVVLPFGGVSSFAVQGHSPNAQCFRGFAPENEANEFRTVTGLYVDAELDVSDDWFVSAALRTENYSDFGGVFTGKFATRYTIGDNLNIRGSISNGFRAPSLQELNYSHTFTFFVDLEPFDGTIFPNNSAEAQAIGIGTLQEERSTNISVGITAKLFNKIELSLDAYQITITDRIFDTSEFSAIDAPVLEPLIGSGLAAFRINGGDISTRGLEFVASYTERIGEGKLGLSLSGILSEREFDNIVIPDLNTNLTDEELAAFYIDRGVIGDYEVGTPRTTIIGTVTYSYGKWSGNFKGNYYGRYSRLDDGIGTLTDTNFAGAGTQGYSDQTFSREATFDFGITYAASDNLSFTLTGSNIFNNYPDLFREEERGFFLYGNSQQGSLGAYYSARTTYSF